MLDACLRSGIYLPHACGHGLCGTCKTQVWKARSITARPLLRADGLRARRRLRPRLHGDAEEDVTIEADVEEDPDARRIAVARLQGEVVGLDDLTHDVKGVRIALEGEGDRLPGRPVRQC